MDYSGGSGYGWSPSGGNQRFSTPRGGNFTPRFQQRPPRFHHQHNSSGPSQHQQSQFSSPYRPQRGSGGYSNDYNRRNQSYGSAAGSGDNSFNSFSSVSSVYYTPPSGGGSFRSRGGGGGSFNRKRDWSTAAGASAAGSFAKSSMLSDPWAGLAPIPVPADCGGGLVPKSGQTHTFLTPRAAAEAAGECSASASASATFASFSEAT